MSGILDNKSRIVDTIVTIEGRRQLVMGDLRIVHASFTDAGTFYEADAVSGSSDASTRIYLEQTSLPQDQVTLEADDSGLLRPFRGSALQQQGGKLFSYTTNVGTGSIIVAGSLAATGSAFASLSTELIETSLENFQKLRLLGTSDDLFEDDGFAIGQTNVTFNITDAGPIDDKDEHVSSVNKTPSLFNDPLLSNHKNFLYLPPVNKADDQGVVGQQQRSFLGDYRPWGRINPLQASHLMNELRTYERLGHRKIINFEPTSLNNRLLCQAFEVEHSTIRKLDVIEFGRHVLAGSAYDVFFLGRIIEDDNGSQSFLHIFTLVFG